LIYTPFAVPIRTPFYDESGRLTKTWSDYLSAVARKAGRSLTWMGVWSKDQNYAVGDLVRLDTDDTLWLAKQLQPFNGNTTTPGTEASKDPADQVWELVYQSPPAIAKNGLPAGGTTDQILAKASNDDYDTKWEDAPSGGGGGGTGTVTHTGGALTADLPVFGAGTDDIKVGTKSGSTNEVMSASGSFTSGHLIKSDASGNAVDAGGVLPASEAGASHNFLTAYDATTGAFSKAQPTESDVVNLTTDLAGKVPTTRTISTTSPLTGGGDLSADRTISLGTQSANEVLAGPTTGSAAAPGFRALVAADIPNIAESQVTSLTSDLALKAPIASPTFTGDPKAPTPTAGDNDTSIATTAFVTAAVAAVVLPATEAGASHNFLTAYNASTGAFSKAQPVEADVVNLVSDLALKAPLASPALTGNPTAPTASPGDNDTSIATTAFVTNAVSTGVAGLVVPSTESGASHNFLTAYDATTGAFTKAQPTESDVVNLVSDLALKAPLASPGLTGTPTAPTAAAGTSTTQIATTAFVEGEIGPGGTGAYFAWGGDGSDGAVTFDGSTTILTLVPSSSIYTLTRDIFCTDLTVNNGVTIKTANYAIFCTGTFTVNGTVHNDGQTGGNGGTATSSTGGNTSIGGVRTSSPGGSSGHYPLLIPSIGGTAGGNGGTTTGTQAGAANSGSAVSSTPVDTNGVAGSTGSSGGKGGTGTSGAGGAARTGGAGGSAASTTVNIQVARAAMIALYGVSYTTSPLAATVHAIQSSNGGNGGAAGGSGGGGDGTNAGGGGGGGGGEGGSGGVVGIFAHTITVGASGIIRSNGGAGGTGGNGRTQTAGNVGGGGGGAGGSGGVGGIVWLVYHRYTNAGTVQAAGGTHGTGGTKGSPHGTGTDDAANGANGSDGPAGHVIAIPC